MLDAVAAYLVTLILTVSIFWPKSGQLYASRRFPVTPNAPAVFIIADAKDVLIYRMVLPNVRISGYLRSRNLNRIYRTAHESQSDDRTSF